MFVERRSREIMPLCDRSATESLRLRRRHGRASYLLALFTERRGKQPTAPQSAGQFQAGRTGARALSS